MKHNFSDIKPGSQLTLMLHSGSVHMKMGAVLEKFLREDLAVITLQTSVKQILNFEKVTIEMVYTSDEGYPYQWRQARIVYLKGNYVLQVAGEGVRFNRRTTFRVGVSRHAQLRTQDGREQRTIVKDVSLTGFSITDRSKELPLKMGSLATLIFEDIGHEINLLGNVLRVEEKEDCIIYGFNIQRSCKDLPSYINIKQRRKRSTTPPSYIVDRKTPNRS